MASRFHDLLSLPRTLFLDGAMGTMLQAGGMPAGVSPSQYCLARPEKLCAVHRAYVEAGSDILTTCTFGASPFKLEAGIDCAGFNRRMAQLAREVADAAGRLVCVAGNIGPSGHFARPLGDLDPEELIHGFEVQARALAEGGCDLFFIETQFDVAEARAAVAAVRRVSDLPIMASMTFEKGVSLTGSTPEIFAETMQNMGVAVVGTNCSLGPEQMRPVVAELLASARDCLVMAEPNAGLPELAPSGETVFPLGPARFAELTAPMAAMACRIAGGCCGTTPEHIRALKAAVEADCPDTEAVRPRRREGIVLTSRQACVHIGRGEPFAVIGERINPTGKPKLTAELQQGVFATALDFAEQQLAAGAAVLDVNVGAHQVDQKTLLPRLASLLASRHPAPLSIDSSDDDAVKATLPWMPASALVNSISGGPERMQSLGLPCRDFGCPFILLPIKGAKLPKTAAERIAILEAQLEEAERLGIPRRLVMVDILALAVSSRADGAVQCLELLRWCRASGFATTLGLSNLSFGLPARELVNATFLCMGAGAGLSSCIANPSSLRVREARAALAVLMDHDPHAESFIAGYSEWKQA